MCRNHRGFIEAVLAVSATGADAVLINTEFPGPQLAQVFGRQPMEGMLHDAEFAAAVDGSGFAGKTLTTEAMAEFPAEPIGRHHGPRRGGKVVLLTSGTTGVPKGAARSAKFKSAAGPLRTLFPRVPFRSGSPILIPPPLFHGMGFLYLNLALLLGSAVVVRRKFDPEAVLADVARHRVRVLIAVPVMLRRLLDVRTTAGTNYDTSSLKAVLSSGAPLAADLGTRFQEAFGPVLFNLYGSSETGFGGLATPDDLRTAPGTVGFPPAGTEVRIL